MSFPGITSRPPYCFLAYTMLFERLSRKTRQSDTPPAASRLRLRLDIQVAPLPSHLSRQPAESAPNLKHAGSKVNVLPFQTEQLAPTHTGSQSQHEKNLLWMPSCSIQQPSGLFSRKRGNLLVLLRGGETTSQTFRAI